MGRKILEQGSEGDLQTMKEEIAYKERKRNSMLEVRRRKHFENTPNLLSKAKDRSLQNY